MSNRTDSSNSPRPAAERILVVGLLGASLAISGMAAANSAPPHLSGPCVLGTTGCVGVIAQAGASGPAAGDPGIVLTPGSALSSTITIPASGFTVTPGSLTSTWVLGNSVGGAYTTVQRTDHPFGEVQTLSVLASDGLLHASQFGISVGVSGRRSGPAPQAAGASFPSGPGNGTLTMLPTNAQGYSPGVTISGQLKGGGSWPNTLTSVSTTLADPRGVGYPEYVSVSYADLLAILLAGKGTATPIGQVWIPLSFPPGGSRPTVIQVNPAVTGGNGNVFMSVDLAPPYEWSGPGQSVPALSTWGIAGLTVLLAAIGFLQLRRTGFSVGI